MISNKSLRTESIWLAALIAVVLIIDFGLYGHSSLGKKVQNFQLHDTYFVLRSRDWLLTLFVLIALPVYLIKEGRKRFSRFLPNIILALLLLIALFVLFYWHRLTFSVQPVGWVVYPPLNAGMQEEISQNSRGFGNTVFTMLELALAISLLLLGIRTGRLWGKQQ